MRKNAGGAQANIGDSKKSKLDVAMDETNLVIVGSFDNEPEVEIAKSALEAAGIDAMIQADTAGRMRPHIAWSGSGFKILVREEDATVARELLETPVEDLDVEDLDDEAE